MNIERFSYDLMGEEQKLTTLINLKTGQAACLVLSSPDPFGRRLYQNTAEPLTDRI